MQDNFQTLVGTATRLAAYNREALRHMKESLERATGCQWSSFSICDDQTIIRYYAAYRSGRLSASQIVLDLALAWYLTQPDWRARFQSVRSALYRLRDWGEDTLYYGAQDIRAFGAPSECLDIVADSVQRRYQNATRRLFRQARMDRRLFFELLQYHGTVHTRRADDLDAPEWYLTMTFD